MTGGPDEVGEGLLDEVEVRIEAADQALLPDPKYTHARRRRRITCPGRAGPGRAGPPGPRRTHDGHGHVGG